VLYKKRVEKKEPHGRNKRVNLLLDGQTKLRGTPYYYLGLFEAIKNMSGKECWLIAAHQIINVCRVFLNTKPKQYVNATLGVVEKDDALLYLMNYNDPHIKKHSQFVIEETSTCAYCDNIQSCY
jgi:hypothetical protein